MLKRIIFKIIELFFTRDEKVWLVRNVSALCDYDLNTNIEEPKEATNEEKKLKDMGKFSTPIKEIKISISMDSED